MNYKCLILISLLFTKSIFSQILPEPTTMELYKQKREIQQERSKQLTELRKQQIIQTKIAQQKEYEKQQGQFLQQQQRFAQAQEMARQRQNQINSTSNEVSNNNQRRNLPDLPPIEDCGKSNSFMGGLQCNARQKHRNELELIREANR